MAFLTKDGQKMGKSLGNTLDQLHWLSGTVLMLCVTTFLKKSNLVKMGVLMKPIYQYPQRR